MDKEIYQRLLHRLIYLSHNRPDIVFVVSLISQFMHQPKEAFKRGSRKKNFILKKNKSVSLEAYMNTGKKGFI